MSVKGEKVFGDEFAFTFVGCEDGAISEARLDVVELPGQIDGVVESSVHALSGFWGMGMTSVTAQEDAMIKRVLFGDALANRVD